jgi:hypothetical protein
MNIAKNILINMNTRKSQKLIAQIAPITKFEMYNSSTFNYPMLKNITALNDFPNV